MSDYLPIYVLHEYLPAFASTVAIELGVAIWLGFWTRRELLAALGVNLVTHPALHVILWVVFCTKCLPLAWPLLLALEIVVWLAEAVLLAWWLRWPVRRAGGVSLALNAASVLLGLWLPG